MRIHLFCILVYLIAYGLVGKAQTDRILEFQITQVTAADVTISPDDQWLIFTMLGHLFRLRVKGGDAEQLTFGPHYHNDPVFSPDGQHVVFVSDRDGSEGNLFLLDLTSMETQQLTREPWVGRPAWSPDGQKIAYLSYLHEQDGPTMLTHATALIREISVKDLGNEIISAEANTVSSVFYLQDGRLAWAAFEGRSPEEIWGSEPVPGAITRVQTLDKDGTVNTLREVQGIAHRFIASPSTDGIYCRRLPTARIGGWFPEEEEILFVSLAYDSVRHITPVSGTSGWDWGPRFELASDGETLYLGEGGQLWAVRTAELAQRTIKFHAQVKLEVLAPTQPAQVIFTEPGFSETPRSIHSPCVSPDGKHIAFGAAGFIWHQSLKGGTAKVISRGDAFATFPAFSPDSHLLAFVETVDGINWIRFLDLKSGMSRAFTIEGSLWQISWSPDGNRLIYVDAPNRRLASVDIHNGVVEEVAPSPSPWWGARPHFGQDGSIVYFSGSGAVYRLTLEKGATPEYLTDLEGPVRNAQVSADGEWLVFGRRRQIWTVPMSLLPIRESDVSQLSSWGGDNFSLIPGTSTIIYAVGNRVWKQHLSGGAPEEISLQVKLERPVPPAVLLKQVRLLEFDSAGFGPETSILIERGRISWIGAEENYRLPKQVVTIEGRGRFVVPGFFDLHVHSGPSVNAPSIAYGVTSLRDLGRGLIWVSSAADRADMTNEPIPRHFYSGYNLWGQPDFVSNENIREAIHELSISGVGLLKIYPTMKWPMQRVAANQARLLSLPIAAHGMSLQEIIKGVRLGYTTLEHSGFRIYEDVIKMLAAAGTGWDPTIGATLGYSQLLNKDSKDSTYYKLRGFFPDVDEHTEEFRKHSWKMGMYPVIQDQQLASVREAYRYNVPLFAGTDAPDMDHLAFPGIALHWELSYLARAGIPPVEVLRIATQRAAEAVGAESDLGTIEVGKIADLILLNLNPLEDIRNTLSIWQVIKGGWVFDPKELLTTAAKRQY